MHDDPLEIFASRFQLYEENHNLMEKKITPISQTEETRWVSRTG